jgi:hypothetical protein
MPVLNWSNMMVICYPPTLIEALQGYQLLKQMLKPTIQIAGFIFLTRRFVGLLLVIDCLVSWKQPMLWSFDSLMPVCACCHAGKSGGFGRFYLLLDLNQWLSPYESDTLTAESSRSSWVKSEKIEKKRKPTKAQPEFPAGWSAKKEKALSLYEMKLRLAR